MQNIIEIDKYKGMLIDLDGSIHPFGNFSFDSKINHGDSFQQEIAYTEWFGRKIKELKLLYNDDPFHSQYFEWVAKGLIMIINSCFQDENGKKHYCYSILLPGNLTNKQLELFKNSKNYIISVITNQNSNFDCRMYDVLLDEDGHEHYTFLDEFMDINDFYDEIESRIEFGNGKKR